MRRKKIILLFVLVLAKGVYAQQMPLISQYKLNGYLYNPSMAGGESSTLAGVLAREQWAGYEQPPRTLWAGAHTRLPSKRIGVGLSVYTDRDGLMNNTGVQGMYAYHIPLDKAQLSLGGSFSFYQYRLNKNEMLARDPLDPLVYNTQRYFAPEAGVGVYYKTLSYYGGLAVDNLFQSRIKIARHDLSDVRMRRIIYLNGGYVYKYNHEITIEPHALLRYTQGYRMQMDVNVAAHYMGMYWGGIGYRSTKDLLFFAGGSYQNYLFGYAFDYAFTEMHKKNFSSHELMVLVRFGQATTTRFQGSDIY